MKKICRADVEVSRGEIDQGKDGWMEWMVVWLSTRAKEAKECVKDRREWRMYCRGQRRLSRVKQVV